MQHHEYNTKGLVAAGWLIGPHSRWLCCVAFFVVSCVMASAAAGVLEDEHYDHGDDGEETYEHLGPILVREERGLVERGEGKRSQGARQRGGQGAEEDRGRATGEDGARERWGGEGAGGLP